MDGRAVKVGYEGNQIKVGDPFDGSDALRFQECCKLVEPNSQCLDRAVRKVRQAAIGNKLLD